MKECVISLMLIACLPVLLNAQNENILSQDLGENTESNTIIKHYLLETTADTCMHELHMADMFGDGWEGATLTLLLNGDTLFNEITLDTGSVGVEYFEATHASEITTIFTCGLWCYECEYAIVGGQGSVLAIDGWDFTDPTGILPGECYADCFDAVNVAEHNTIDVRLFPNPANDKITIETSAEISQLSLFDISGRQIEKHENISAKQFSIEVSQYDPGTYLLYVETQKGRIVRKVVVTE